MKLKSLTACWLVIVAASATTANAHFTPWCLITTNTVATQENANPAPKLEKVTLVNINFGNNASVVVKGSDNQQRTIIISANTKYYNDQTTGSLTKFAQNELSNQVHIQTQKVNDILTVTKIWDTESYTKWVNEHNGSRNGQVSGLYAKALLIGDQYYTITENTQFILEGKAVARKKLEGKPVLWVKCIVKNGVAIADKIADTSESLGVVIEGNSTRPPSSSRPASSGTVGGSQSTGGVSPTEKGKLGERPASTGSGKGSPTEQNRPGEKPTGNDRPTSTGKKALSPTERAAQAKKGYQVMITFTMTDTDDNPKGNEPAEVLKAAAKEIGVHDDTVEVYGLLKFNNVKRWELKRENAENNKKIKDERVEPKDGNLPAFLVTSETLKLTGFLKDRDNMSKDDMLYDVNLNLNLYELSLTREKKEYKTNGGKATMYITVVAK